MKKRRVLPLPGKFQDPVCPCGSGRSLSACCRSRELAQKMAQAVAAHQAHRLDEAFAAYAGILEDHPHHADALHYQGVIHFQRGDYAAAVERIRCAIDQRGDVAAYYANYGNALKRLGQPDQALAAYDEAEHLDNRQAATHFNRALLLMQLGRGAEAVAALQVALRLQPEWPEAWLELGRALYAEEDIDRAAEAFSAALRYNPRLAPAHHALGSLLLRFGDVDAALQSFEQAQHLEPDVESHCTSRLFALGLSVAHNGAAILSAHREWQSRFARDVTPLSQGAIRGDRLRLAYLSGDLRRHAMRFFVRPLLRQHDRSRFEIFVYATHGPLQDDGFSAELRALAEHWVDVHALDDAALARRIAHDGIDILVDLAGHSAGGRMRALAAHPARFQCSMLGYMTTTGADAIDARIADPVALPPAAEPWFSEKILRLPHSQWCYAPDAETPPVGEAPVLSHGHVTYGAFHNVAKINARVLALWVRLLLSQPMARLLMVGWGETAKHWLRASFDQAGLGARVEVLDPLPYDRYLELYGRIDVAFDAFPYAGGTVSCEALWMGVPVLTLAHDSPAGRGGASIMIASGLPDWIAVDDDDFLARAERLTQDHGTLATLRAGLRERLRASPLMDSPGYVAALENLLVAQLT